MLFRIGSEKMGSVNIGGQAVIEGVMMKSKDKYAVAIRKPDSEIILEKKEYIGWATKHKILGVPLIRGAVAFVESMVLGTKILTFSAEFFEVEGESNTEKGKFDLWIEEKFGDKANDVVVGISVVLAMALAFLLFFLLPLGISQILRNQLSNGRIMNLVDGIVRVVILFLYIFLISKMKDIQRVFQYHCAEHKTIHCLENGLELTVENVMKQSRLHKRCGTSFLLYVVTISIIVLTIINVQTFWLRLLVRIICLPLIAGISYEVLKVMGRVDSPLTNFLSKPGLFLQKMTTRDPDAAQVEVAIAALKGVLDTDDFASVDSSASNSNDTIASDSSASA